MVALSFAVTDPPTVGAAPIVWVLHDGKAGMASQALGVAEATGFLYAEKPLAVRRPWIWAAPSL